MNPDLPCLCGHPRHDEKCPSTSGCECRKYIPDDHRYPCSIGWVTS